VGTPAETAVAATVNAWLHRSGASDPAVTLTTSDLGTPPRYAHPAVDILDRVLEAVALTLLITAVVGIGWVAVYVVYKVFQEQR
jgi:hypothetical protein